MTRTGYNAWRKRPPSRHALQDARLKELIEKAFADLHITCGAPRIHAKLALAHGIRTSRKRVARLTLELDIVGVSRRRTKGKRRSCP